MSTRITVSYLTIRPDRLRAHRTIEVTPNTLVDVDTEGRIIGIETLGGAQVNWVAIFADDRFRFAAATHDPASGPEPATGAPGTAGVDAGTWEAGS